MRNSRSRIRLIAALGVAATAVGTVAAVQPAAAAPARHPLEASTPRWVNHAKDRGATSKSATISFGLLLNLRHQNSMASEVRSVSEPSSKNYRHYLTHHQYVARYAPTSSQVSKVRSWLHSNGLHVTGSLTHGLYLGVSGSAARVEKAFDTPLRNYRYQGHALHTNTRKPSIAGSTPAAVRNAIRGVIGLDQGSQLKKPADTVLPGPPPGSRYGVPPCSKYYGQKIATNKPSAYGKKWPYAVCGYVPQQYQGAYGESNLLKYGINGTGSTVAIVDAYASPTMLADAQTYSSKHGLPRFTSGQYSQVLPAKFNVYDPADAQGWYGEETLDVEAVHGMAPGAKVVYVGGSDDLNGLNIAWAQTIDQHRADIVTDSWTFGSDNVDGPTVAFFDDYAFEAAMTGITVNFSSGDDGDNSSGGTDPADRTTEFPADSQYLTGVGGTSVFIGAKNNWEKEYGWSNAYSNLKKGAWTPTPPGAYSSGGGGGVSTVYGQPFYQRGKVPASFSKPHGGPPMRVVPDISMAGDPNTGYLVGETQQFSNGTYYAEYRIGGTSLSSPLLAGTLALVDQVAGKPIGFANPLYYKLLGNGALHDLVKPASPTAQVRTNYVNAVDDSQGKSYVLQTVDALSGSLKDVKGYDNETGVGSPDGPLFFLGMAFGGNTSGGLAKLRHAAH